MFLYIDPGTGSMLTQAVIAGVVGFIMFFKQLKHKLKSLFKKHTYSDIEKDEE